MPESLLVILAQMFSYKLCEIIKNTFFIEHLRTTASKQKYALLKGLHYQPCPLHQYTKIAGEFI